jgi:hypothetical protein
MSYTLDGITLPGGLTWSNKYDWTYVNQDINVALSGSLIIQEDAQLQGRPITLAGGENFCWAERSLIDTLYGMLSDTGKQMTLDMGPDDIHTVMWVRPTPIVVKPVVPSEYTVDSSIYYVESLQFIKVG